MAIKRNYHNKQQVIIGIIEMWESHVFENLFDLNDFLMNDCTDVIRISHSDYNINISKEFGFKYNLRINFTSVQRGFNPRIGDLPNIRNLNLFEGSLKELKNKIYKDISLQEHLFYIAKFILKDYKHLENKKNNLIKILEETQVATRKNYSKGFISEKI